MALLGRVSFAGRFGIQVGAHGLIWKAGAGRAGGAQDIRRPGITKISRAKINIDVDRDWRRDDAFPILRGAIKGRDGGQRYFAVAAWRAKR
jgi:hypothetical protein